MVFAVAVGVFSKILLYDQANFDKAPFLSIDLEDPTLSLISYPPRPIYVTSMTFSSDGKYLLVGCSGGAHYILDAFEGYMIAKLEGHIGLERKNLTAPPLIEPSQGISGEEVTWTPDSKYVISGSLDGRILIWDVQNLQPRTELERKYAPIRVQPTIALDGHPGPSRCVKFNPRFAMMCTAGTELVRVVSSNFLDDILIVCRRHSGFLIPAEIWTTREKMLSRRKEMHEAIDQESNLFAP